MKQLLLAALTLLAVACSQKSKNDQSQTETPTPQSTPVPDDAHEQQVDRVMAKVGNIHNPSAAELVANTWCVVADEELNTADAEANHMKLSINGSVQIVTPAEGTATALTTGRWSLKAATLNLNLSFGSTALGDQDYVVSLARSPAAILLRLKSDTKQSLLYRDCDI